MQHVFRCHDKSRFAVNIYSVSSSNADEGLEVRAIRESSDEITYLSPSLMSPMEMYQRMMQDEFDVLVDLRGYAGTSVRAEYGIHPSAFVYCCHSRTDKIDLSTFQSWMNALLRIRSASSSKWSDMDATMTGTDKAERTGIIRAMQKLQEVYFVK